MEKVSWENLLDQLVALRRRQYRTDAEMEESRIQTIEFVVQSMLEKLRDEERTRQGQFKQPA